MNHNHRRKNPYQSSPRTEMTTQKLLVGFLVVMLFCSLVQIIITNRTIDGHVAKTKENEQAEREQRQEQLRLPPKLRGAPGVGTLMDAAALMRNGDGAVYVTGPAAPVAPLTTDEVEEAIPALQDQEHGNEPHYSHSKDDVNDGLVDAQMEEDSAEEPHYSHSKDDVVEEDSGDDDVSSYEKDATSYHSSMDPTTSRTPIEDQGEGSPPEGDFMEAVASSLSEDHPQRTERCAINFFGLPRAFASLVLPSMKKNVLEQNKEHHCDYFIHYYNLTSEAPGRSGAGGDIHADEILLLEKAVAELNVGVDKPSSVTFISDTEDDFQNMYGELLNKIHAEKDTEGHLLYYPWKSQSYTPTSVDNIVKMWHSIESAWNLMEQHADENSVKYTRVAMLRSDVVYMSPIDIWARGDGITRDTENRRVVIPGFGRHPVSDRIIYGPYSAVKEWSAKRFSSLDDHVYNMFKKHPGRGMHSERFVKYSILPQIKNLESEEGRPLEVVESETICFFRARADESVWIEDCDGTEKISLPSIVKSLEETHGGGDRKKMVESVLGRACGDIHNFTRTDSTVAYLDCAFQADYSLSSTSSDEEGTPTEERAESISEGDEQGNVTTPDEEEEAAVEADETNASLDADAITGGNRTGPTQPEDLESEAAAAEAWTNATDTDESAADLTDADGQSMIDETVQARTTTTANTTDDKGESTEPAAEEEAGPASTPVDTEEEEATASVAETVVEGEPMAEQQAPDQVETLIDAGTEEAASPVEHTEEMPDKDVAVIVDEEVGTKVAKVFEQNVAKAEDMTLNSSKESNDLKDTTDSAPEQMARDEFDEVAEIPGSEDWRNTVSDMITTA